MGSSTHQLSGEDCWNQHRVWAHVFVGETIFLRTCVYRALTYSYTYDDAAGEGVDVYVVGTSVLFLRSCTVVLIVF